MLGQRWPASETPLQWRFAGGADDGPFIAVFGYSIPSTNFFFLKKTLSNMDPSDKTFWIRACYRPSNETPFRQKQEFRRSQELSEL